MMVARIADRTWTCDCCGSANDQRGCVKGPPCCGCYSGTLSPRFCIICDRCWRHCPGSELYQEPKDDWEYHRIYQDGSPVKRSVRPHTFVSYGLCDCDQVVPEDLLENVTIRDGLAPRRIHVRCGRWRLDEKKGGISSEQIPPLVS